MDILVVGVLLLVAVLFLRHRVKSVASRLDSSRAGREALMLASAMRYREEVRRRNENGDHKSAVTDESASQGASE